MSSPTAPVPQDHHSWTQEDKALYELFIALSKDIANLGENGKGMYVGYDMTVEFKACLKYLGTDPATRGQLEVLWSDESDASGFTATCESLVAACKHLPSHVLGGCRNYWKWFMQHHNAQHQGGSDDEELV
jgi:hypothetical protein